jgi:hypothetical protein
MSSRVVAKSWARVNARANASGLREQSPGTVLITIDIAITSQRYNLWDVVGSGGGDAPQESSGVRTQTAAREVQKLICLKRLK